MNICKNISTILISAFIAVGALCQADQTVTITNNTDPKTWLNLNLGITHCDDINLGTRGLGAGETRKIRIGGGDFLYPCCLHGIDVLWDYGKEKPHVWGATQHFPINGMLFCQDFKIGLSWLRDEEGNLKYDHRGNLILVETHVVA